MELHVAAHHLPVGRRAPGAAFWPLVIGFAVGRRERRRAAKQQDRQQLQQIHPHVGTPLANRSSIWRCEGKIVKTKVRRWNRVIIPRCARRARAESRALLSRVSYWAPRKRLLPCLAKDSPPFLPFVHTRRVRQKAPPPFI